MHTRRSLFYAAAAAGGVGFGPVVRAVDAPSAGAGAPAGARIPGMKFVYECDATLSEPQAFGPTIEGVRRIIPITGGTFSGPQLRGQVMGGSYDWNLSRRDGGNSVEAAYFLRTDDGVTLRVVNRGVGEAAPRKAGSGERFFMFTNPVFEAPTGKYDCMNRSMFMATLGARHGAKNAVLIRVFMAV